MRSKLLRNSSAWLACSLAGFMGVQALAAEENDGGMVVVTGPSTVVINGGGGQAGGGRGGKSGMAAAQAAAQVDIPHAAHIVEAMLNNWMHNAADIPNPNQLLSYRSYQATVAISSLVELDDKTVNKLDQMNSVALAKGRTIGLKYGKKLDAAFRDRLTEARKLLDKNDQECLDGVLKAWDACDEAARTVAETDPQRRAVRVQEETEKSLSAVLKDLPVALKDRLLKLFAARSNSMYPMGEADAKVALYFGQNRIEWTDLFKLKDGDKEKLAELDKHYLAIREMINGDLTKELNKLYAETRDAMIAAIPSQKDREDLQKLADWTKTNLGKLQDAHQAIYESMRGMGYNPDDSQEERIKKSQDSMKQYQTSTQQVQDIKKDLAATYPDRFKEKVGTDPVWNGVGGAGFAGGPVGQAGGRSGGPQGGGSTDNSKANPSGNPGGSFN